MAGNGQTGGSAPANQTKTHNVSINISGPSTMVRFGHKFNSWNTALNGSGTKYVAGNSYSTNADLDLYAQWTPDKYTVTYKGNGYTGGSVPVNQAKIHDVDLVLAQVGTMVRSNTTFFGWNTKADGSGVSYAGGATYDGNTPIILYAQWQQSLTKLQEDFETPSAQTDYVKGSLPSNGNWVGANDGASGSKSDLHGMTDKAGLDFAAADPNQQAYAFKGANSGITTAVGKIGILTNKETYTITFDVMPLDGNGSNIYTNYRAQLIAFAPGAPRNDCRSTPSGSLLLKEVSGTNAASAISFTYTTGEISDTSYIGYDLGVRFIGSTSSGVIDNVIIKTSSLASPPTTDVFVAWLGGAGSGFNGDSNGDGVSNGLAWALGAAGPSTASLGLRPTVVDDKISGYMIFNYRRSDSANDDLNTIFKVEFGTNLSDWTEAINDGDSVIITSYDNDYASGVDRVEVKLKKAIYEDKGKLFSRLKVERSP
jgi:Listeria-Bacteroides repeat domain (List_Bact_rpt)